MTNKEEDFFIAFGLSFYQDAQSLDRCINSIFDTFNATSIRLKVLAIDGKYSGYPAKNALSNDGSRDIVDNYSQMYEGQVELYDYPNLLERQKRQKYVDIAAKQNIPFLFIIDSDEYVESRDPESFIDELKDIETEWKLNNKIKTYEINGTLPVGGLPLLSNVHQITSIDLNELGYPFNIAARPRLWYRPQDVHYTTKHYYFKRRDESGDNKSLGEMINNSDKYKSYNLKNMIIYHDHNERSEEREIKRQYYEREKLPDLEK